MHDRLCPGGCGNPFENPTMLACQRCWFRLPAAIRRAVNNAWRARRADPRDPGRVTAHEAAKQAAGRWWANNA